MTKSDFSGFWVEEERKGDAIVSIGNVWKKGLLLGILLLLALVGSAQAEGFQVRVEKEIIGFEENQITVETDQTGLLTLTLSDNYGTYRTTTREAKRGTTTFMWDGLGENEERLPSGSYTLHALLVTARGNQETQINVTVGKAKQALLFALRSSDTLYLDTDGKPLRASLGYGEGNWGVGSGVADYVFSHEDAYPEQVYLAPQTGEDSADMAWAIPLPVRE